jgi:hypothetical protein
MVNFCANSLFEVCMSEKEEEQSSGLENEKKLTKPTLFLQSIREKIGDSNGQKHRRG